jgi:hypothetical protein
MQIVKEEDSEVDEFLGVFILISLDDNTEEVEPNFINHVDQVLIPVFCV